MGATGIRAKDPVSSRYEESQKCLARALRHPGRFYRGNFVLPTWR